MLTHQATTAAAKKAARAARAAGGANDDDDDGGVNGDALRLVASPWSPPAWMKAQVPPSRTNVYTNTTSSSSSSRGAAVMAMTGSHPSNGLRAEARVMQTWAQYISRFIEAYDQQEVR